MDEATKYCPRCETTKPLGEFYVNKSAADGVQRYCKPCWKTYRKKRYDASDKERLTQYAWRRANIERYHETQRQAYHRRKANRLNDLTAGKSPVTIGI